MFDRLKATLRGMRVPSIAERERAYLEESVSLYDLECRQRDIDRGLVALQGRYY